jgi:hypothetical protein
LTSLGGEEVGGLVIGQDACPPSGTLSLSLSLSLSISLSLSLSLSPSGSSYTSFLYTFHNHWLSPNTVYLPLVRLPAGSLEALLRLSLKAPITACLSSGALKAPLRLSSGSLKVLS